MELMKYVIYLKKYTEIKIKRKGKIRWQKFLFFQAVQLPRGLKEDVDHNLVAIEEDPGALCFSLNTQGHLLPLALLHGSDVINNGTGLTHRPSRTDEEVLRDGCEAAHLELKASRGSGLGFHQTGYREGRLQGKAVEGGKVLLRNPTLYQDPLGQAGAVPQDEKTHLTARAEMRDPTSQGDELSHSPVKGVNGAIGRVAVEHRRH